MPGMRGLTLILADAAPDRVRTALSLALAQVALGGRARLYAQDRAVTALARAAHAEDAAESLTAAGLPDRRALLAMAAAEGVALIACATGLALTGLAADALADGVETGGLVGLLATLGEDRLVVV